MKPPERPAVDRVTFNYIGRLILEQFNLERGIGYTLKGLLLRPGKVLHEYLFENRTRMVRPLPFLLLIVGATVFLSFHFLGLDAELKNSLEKDSWLLQLPESIQTALKDFIAFLQQYFNLAMMSSIPVTALVTYWFFREHRLYYAEHLVLNTYIYSIQSLLTLIFLPFMLATPPLGGVAAFLTLAYMAYAFIEIFEQNWWEGILKTIGVYISSQVIYWIFFITVLFFIAILS